MELLVVIAIIGILVALLLPAVQAAREAARRMNCKNHLRQLGIAAHHYHDVHHRLPSGWVADVPEGEPGWGWGALLLPYMEQSNLHDLVVFEEHIDDPVNRPARTRFLPIFSCPSDAAPYRTFQLPAGGHAPPHGGVTFPMLMARANFVGVFGALEIEEAPSRGDGIFFHNSRIRFADVLDGLSNTLMIGERSSWKGHSTWVGVVHGADEAMARVVGAADHPPNHPHSHLDDFTSHHPGGVQFTMADGSVQTIHENIELQVYHALATRGGSEPAQLP